MHTLPRARRNVRGYPQPLRTHPKTRYSGITSTRLLLRAPIHKHPRADPFVRNKKCGFLLPYNEGVLRRSRSTDTDFLVSTRVCKLVLTQTLTYATCAPLGTRGFRLKQYNYLLLQWRFLENVSWCLPNTHLSASCSQNKPARTTAVQLVL